MKKILMAMILAPMVLMVIGCGKNNDKLSIANSRGQRGTVTAQDASLLQGQIWQFTSGAGSGSAEFDAAMKDYLGASIPEEYVGHINGDYYSNDSTGVFIGGRISVTNGRFNPSGMARSNFSGGSFLVGVYDSFTGQKDQDGNVIPAIGISYPNVAGYVENQNVHLEARDEYNRIILDGAVDGTYFTGRVSYENYRSENSSNVGGQPQIGWFRIRACSLFNCN